MSRSGFFLIQVDATGEAPRRSSSLRLEWLDGKPYVTVLGGGHDVRRNDVGIPPGMPMALQDGDTITIGQARLIWQEPAGQGAQIPVQSAEEADREKPPEPGYSVSINSPQGRKEFTLTDNDYRVGRAPDNDIFIDDERISRYHAQLIRRASGYEIVDLGSVNGLRHEKKQISRKMLIDGDEVWLSSGVSLIYHAIHPAPADQYLTQEIDRALYVQNADVARITPKEDVALLPSKEADETVVRRTPTDQAPVLAPSDVGESEHSQEMAHDRTAIIDQGAGARSGETDETVVRPSDPEDATVVLGKPQDERTEVHSDATVVTAQKADDRAKPPQKDSGPSEETGAATGEPAADQTSDAASGPADATVVRPAGVIPDPPTWMQAIKPELDGRKEVPADEGETAVVDMAKYAGDTSIAEVSGTIIRDTQIPHLVVHLPNHTWETQFSKDLMSVGRDVNCDIHIPDESVSRHHALIERHGDDYVIREDQSRNGLWFNQQRIEKRALRDGDVVSIGRAKLMFKGGFAADDLTLVGRPRVDGTLARRPVVFVPGFGGSELWLGSERLWPNPKHIISNPEMFRLPGDPRIEARSIVSDIVIVPGIVKQQQYSRLGDYLEEGLGYKRGRDLLEFAYDWRQDIRLASQRLAETIEQWGVQPPVTIIAHSLGTLVTRYYVERLGGKNVVDRTVLLGGPHYGTPKGLSIILAGPGILPFGIGDERMRQVIASFPSAYQILPVYHCVTDQNDEFIDLLHDESWLPEQQRPFLRAARSFRNELGAQSSVPSVSIFGYGLKTMLRVKIHRGFDGPWEKVDFVEDTAGDLSVPSGSAVLKNSEIHPVLQEHGSLYVDDDVKMRLKVELTRSTSWEKGM